MLRRADFYLLPQADDDSRMRFLCRVCDKALQQKLNVFIYAEDPTQAEQLDRLLWLIPEDAFLPHHLIGSKTPKAPISIGLGDQRPTHRELFFNAASTLPSFAFEFDRIAEVVIQAPDALLLSRQNFVSCRDQGYEMHWSDMRQSSR